MTFSDLLVPTYVQMLGTMSGWLDKAASQRPDGEADALMAARIAPDMFPLATQVRFACRQAQEAVFRLRGEGFPPALDALLEEGRNGGDHPGTIADAQARIAETLAVIAAQAPGMTLPADADIAHALPNGMTMDLTATQFVRDWALSQFYFHLVTAYAILRAQGITLGKADYIAHMLPHFRRPAA